MGARSSTETALRVLAALLDEPTWKQAELARHVGVSTQTVKRCLEELEAAGVPLVSDKDHPHVYWSVPRSWLPDGVNLPRELLVDLLRRVARGATGTHDRLLAHLVDATPDLRDMVARVQAAHVADGTGFSSSMMAALEDASDSHAVVLTYRKSRKAPVESRVCSPACFVDRHQHLLARCHTTGRARRFRLDRILAVHTVPGAEHRPLSDDEIKEQLSGAVDGFRSPGSLVSVRFRLMGPASEVGWMIEDLPEDLHVEDIDEGYLVHGQTGALGKLAAKLVTWGAVVRYDDEDL
ncbi:MAG: winged helix-turn-helix transcriptional regulator, partial [Myxococcales bacterium]|nr:winged helix-turn-helix transcriptional regulator [Myxococcales bacterium]